MYRSWSALGSCARQHADLIRGLSDKGSCEGAGALWHHNEIPVDQRICAVPSPVRPMDDLEGQLRWHGRVGWPLIQVGKLYTMVAGAAESPFHGTKLVAATRLALLRRRGGVVAQRIQATPRCAASSMSLGSDL